MGLCLPIQVLKHDHMCGDHDHEYLDNQYVWGIGGGKDPIRFCNVIPCVVIMIVMIMLVWYSSSFLIVYHFIGVHCTPKKEEFKSFTSY